ncbi:Predicted metalloprotease, contains C-terminal PDZ domain [Ekhidna lutea]|uniref:Predicted metalloprotease, contains C-terminal PDZ domain n=1 Tax=Ekhidna lutea TaxID=447679 RepID=A0A239HFH3_EKHLU|nr:PDZ domain-containing protein [Ekhidna lutea]SNS80139.1 Predicted metalloprotease, contains C-terminal PDZ domain [Ekhidna lutea]
MKKLLAYSLLFSSISLLAQESYKINIDLTKAKNDKVPVEITLPEITEDTVEYHMAKVVPGTYSISDFGRFVTEFKAFDKEGNKLKFEKASTNRWVIPNAKELAKISYWIEDSYDDFDGYGDNKLFEPGGMSIEADNGVYVLNTFGFIGYVDGYKFKPFELTITHDEEIKGATSLKRSNETATSDTFIADNYNFLADAPIMYSKPDIVTKEIAGAEVLVSVYSPNKILSAADVMDNIDELMEAQAKYLGGKLPVDRYAYLIYLFDGPTISGAWGALEHSYSSLYTLPEMDPARISQTVKDVAAHEFFHIVTPLNIHSEEIHDFNYIEPEMSQHLWLYEGVTEYSSHHVQVKYDLYDLEDFLEQMKDKMNQQDQYNVDIPYTEFSENILEPVNERRYGDVYAGGALIAWCLDLTIIKSTNGQKDLQAVLRELSKQYGPKKAFKDEELFSEIEKITNNEVGDFLRTYVGGAEKLPYSKILGWAGIRYSPESDEQVITAGKFTPALNEEQEIYVAGVDEMNEFGKDLGFKEGDVLLEWNGKEITLETFSEVIQSFYNETEAGDKITVLVRREVKNKMKEVKLKAKAKKVKSSQKHSLEVIENPSPEQQKIRSFWLGTE